MSTDEAEGTTSTPTGPTEAAAAVKPAVSQAAEPAIEASASAAATVAERPAETAPRRDGPTDGDKYSDYDRRRPRRRPDAGGDAVRCRPLEVIVKDDKVDQAIRQLKNRLAREGVLRELKNRRHYFKPSELKRIKRREAARRRRKQARQRTRS